MANITTSVIEDVRSMGRARHATGRGWRPSATAARHSSLPPRPPANMETQETRYEGAFIKRAAKENIAGETRRVFLSE